MIHYIACKSDEGIQYDEFDTYEEAYNNYMQRYTLYKSGQIWYTQKRINESF